MHNGNENSQPGEIKRKAKPQAHRMFRKTIVSIATEVGM